MFDPIAWIVFWDDPLVRAFWWPSSILVWLFLLFCAAWGRSTFTPDALKNKLELGGRLIFFIPMFVLTLHVGYGAIETTRIDANIFRKSVQDGLTCIYLDKGQLLFIGKGTSPLNDTTFAYYMPEEINWVWGAGDIGAIFSAIKAEGYDISQLPVCDMRNSWYGRAIS